MPNQKRVVVLRDFSYYQRPGEEELAVERFLKSAPDRVSVSVQPPEFDQVEQIFAEADILITFGLKNYSGEVFDWILRHPNHVHVVQDWWEPQQPNAEYRDKITLNAAVVIYQSPMHRERYERIYGTIPGESAIIPFPLEISDLNPPFGVFEKQDAVLWCAPWHPDYGNDLMLSWARKNHQHVHVSGLEAPEGSLAPMVKGIGKVALDAIGPTLAQYTQFLYLPRKPIPFGLAFYLAHEHGLELTYSGEIGCLSYDSDDLSDECLNATDTFWEAVAA